MKTKAIAVAAAMLWMPCLLGGIEDSAADTIKFDTVFVGDIAGRVTVTAQTAGQSATKTARPFSIEDVLGVMSASIGDLSADGWWLVTTTRSLVDRLGVDNHRYGDPTYVAPNQVEVTVIDTRTGESRTVFPEKRNVRGLTWSPDAAFLAFMEFDGEWYRPLIWVRATGEVHEIELPSGMEIADNSELFWLPDSTRLLLALRPQEWRSKVHERFVELTSGPIVVLSNEDEFLAWEALRRSSIQRSLHLVDVGTGAITEVLAGGPVRSYELSEDGAFLSYLEDITEETDYERIFGSESKVQVLTLVSGESRTLLDSDKGVRLSWSGDHHTYAYTKKGDIFVGTVDGEEREIEPVLPDEDEGEDQDEAEGGETDAAVAGPDDAEDGDEDEEPRFSIVRVSHSGDAMILSDDSGLWLMDSATAGTRKILDIDGDDDDAPRYSVVEWSRDGRSIYFSYASRTQWERGLTRFDTTTGQLGDVFKDDRIYTGYRWSKDESTIALSISHANRPADIYVADAGSADFRRLTDVNPQLADVALGDVDLISYLDVDGNELEGVLYYPVGYEASTKVPTVFHIYETFFDPRFSGTTNLLTAHGYAVVQPSVKLEIGYPGEAWVKGVTAAANKLIEMGIADPDRLGVYGTSYGGYATNLLITQTQRFKAAINISGKVNMVSFYTDSPRLGVRNIHAPENSQDRIGSTLWEQPDKYITHSAVMYADRISTPLLLLTGDQDHNVPARQAMEMYYALRRLGKRVEWVNYMNGGHGMPRGTEEEVRDYHERILAWFDTYLVAEADEAAGDEKKE